MQHLMCPQCGEAIQGQNINIQAMKAVCAACGLVFEVPQTADTNKAKEKDDRDILKYYRPERLRVESGDQMVRITLPNITKQEEISAGVLSVASVGVIFFGQYLISLDAKWDLVAYMYSLMALLLFVICLYRLIHRRVIEIAPHNIVTTYITPFHLKHESFLGVKGATSQMISSKYTDHAYEVLLDTKFGQQRLASVFDSSISHRYLVELIKATIEGYTLQAESRNKERA